MGLHDHHAPIPPSYQQVSSGDLDGGCGPQLDGVLTWAAVFEKHTLQANLRGVRNGKQGGVGGSRCWQTDSKASQ